MKYAVKFCWTGTHYDLFVKGGTWVFSATFQRKAAAMCPSAPEPNTVLPDSEQDDYVPSNTLFASSCLLFSAQLIIHRGK